MAAGAVVGVGRDPGAPRRRPRPMPPGLNARWWPPGADGRHMPRGYRVGGSVEKLPGVAAANCRRPVGDAGEVPRAAPKAAPGGTVIMGSGKAPPAMLDEAGLLNFIIASGNA
jgi:hypothetical protein